MRLNMLDVRQAAEVLEIAPADLRRLVEQKAIPYVMVGPFVRFDAAVLKVWRDRAAKVGLGDNRITIDLTSAPTYTRNV